MISIRYLLSSYYFSLYLLYSLGMITNASPHWLGVKVAQSCPTLCNPMEYSPWNSPGQNTGVTSLSLLQGIFPTQGWNPGLPHCRWILYQLCHKGSPKALHLHSNLIRPPVFHRTSLEAQTVKRLAYNVGGLGSIPGSGRSSGEGNGDPLQYSCLENPMDRRAWWATVHGVTKSRTELNDFTFTSFPHVPWASQVVHR